MDSRPKYHCYLFVTFVLGILLAGCWSSFSNSSDGSRYANSIFALALQDNYLWLCGAAGPKRLNLTNNTIEKFEDSVSCEHLLVARNGWIWESVDELVRYFDGKVWRDPQLESSIRYRGDYRLSETTDGSIWIGGSSLRSFDPQTNQLTTVIPELPEPTPTPGPPQTGFIATSPSPGYIGPVFEAADGALWYNNQFEGLVRWDRKSNSRQLWSEKDFGGTFPIPTKFIQAGDGSIWVGMVHGVHRFHDGHWQTWSLPGEGTRYSREQGDFQVIDMIEDRDGKIWVMFQYAGVAVWDGSTWKPVWRKSDRVQLMHSIYGTSFDEVWIGFLHDTTIKYYNGKLKTYPSAVRVFLETPDHRLFGGGSEGLFLYNRTLDQWELYPVQ